MTPSHVARIRPSHVAHIKGSHTRAKHVLAQKHVLSQAPSESSWQPPRCSSPHMAASHMAASHMAATTLLEPSH
jgi:hypothetical protein